MKLIETIYLADDHELVVQGISSLLEKIDGVNEIKIFPNGLDLYQACLNQKPDLIFLDIEMPQWDGRKTLVELKKSFPSLPCIMLSMLNEKGIVNDCIEKGANAYLNKDSSLQEFKEAILAVQGNEIFYSKEVLKVMAGLKNPTTSSSYHLIEPLSEREHEILVQLCEGLSPKEIGEKLFLSPRTIETHKNNIMQKFEVNSIAKLISVAIKNRLV
ncbi:MAG: response regulator transcription factor [Bacteroidota bacterium]